MTTTKTPIEVARDLHASGAFACRHGAETDDAVRELLAAYDRLASGSALREAKAREVEARRAAAEAEERAAGAERERDEAERNARAWAGERAGMRAERDEARAEVERLRAASFVEQPDAPTMTCGECERVQQWVKVDGKVEFRCGVFGLVSPQPPVDSTSPPPSWCPGPKRRLPVVADTLEARVARLEAAADEAGWKACGWLR